MYALKTTWPPRSAVEDSSWYTKAQYDSSSPWKHNIMLSFLPHWLLNMNGYLIKHAEVPSSTLNDAKFINSGSTYCAFFEYSVFAPQHYVVTLLHWAIANCREEMPARPTHVHSSTNFKLFWTSKLLFKYTYYFAVYLHQVQSVYLRGIVSESQNSKNNSSFVVKHGIIIIITNVLASYIAKMACINQYLFRKF